MPSRERLLLVFFLDLRGELARDGRLCPRPLEARVPLCRPLPESRVERLGVEVRRRTLLRRFVPPVSSRPPRLGRARGALPWVLRRPPMSLR